jgi:hypothetical protein
VKEKREEQEASTAIYFCSLSRTKSNNFLFGRGVVGPESDGSVKWKTFHPREQQQSEARALIKHEEFGMHPTV